MCYVSSVHSPQVKDDLRPRGDGQVSRGDITVKTTLIGSLVEAILMPILSFYLQRIPFNFFLYISSIDCHNTSLQISLKQRNFFTSFSISEHEKQTFGDSTLEISSQFPENKERWRKLVVWICLTFRGTPPKTPSLGIHWVCMTWYECFLYCTNATGSINWSCDGPL